MTDIGTDREMSGWMSGSAERDLGLLVNSKLNMSQKHALAARRVLWFWLG